MRKMVNVPTSEELAALAARVDTLTNVEARVAALEARVAALEATLTAMKAALKALAAQFP